ncbi:hypothetical protein ACSS7Z_08650 [Microbacterium sp. A82]|uniref:hypothetical protein n=1 Tax=Microbacterium sp. A82 TaxID=3450452 RepID=UPI003F33C383
MITTAYFIALPLLPIIAAFVILRRRNRVEPEARVPGIVYLTQLVGATAAGWATLVAVATVPMVFRRMTAVHAEAAVSPFTPWPIPTADTMSPEPYVMVAHVDSIRVGVAQADVGTQILQALGSVISALPPIAIGIFVVILCERIIRRAPFAAHLVKLSWIGAGVFLVTGFAGQLLSGLASFRLAEIAFELIRADSPAANLPTPAWPAWPDLWPLWGALALGVLAVLIRHGIRLQRDTEGLV